MLYTSYSGKTQVIMLDSLVAFIQTLPPIGVLLFAILITYTENIFPPSPSDMLLVFCGTLIGFGTVDFIPLLLTSTIGSTLGFLTMYGLGLKLEHRFTQSRALKFISSKQLEKVENWFQKYGYWLIVGNRFLSGTRAVISFFAGMSRLNFTKTSILSAISSAIWNAILLGAGWSLGSNWKIIGEYLALYGKTLTGVAVVALVIGSAFFWWNKKHKKAESLS
jgi:membrane protein DedA with SNARE-associated domain